MQYTVRYDTLPIAKFTSLIDAILYTKQKKEKALYPFLWELNDVEGNEIIIK